MARLIQHLHERFEVLFGLEGHGMHLTACGDNNTLQGCSIMTIFLHKGHAKGKTHLIGKVADINKVA